MLLQAVALTALVVASLTAYTFRAVRKGQDFTFLAPWLFSSEAPGLFSLEQARMLHMVCMKHEAA